MTGPKSKRLNVHFNPLKGGHFLVPDSRIFAHTRVPNFTAWTMALPSCSFFKPGIQTLQNMSSVKLS